MEKIVLPTGYLFTDSYSKGMLETLSIGDYGKERNVKADFLGYTNPINGVQNGPCKPLSEKWVITLSTQFGCTMTCNFCDVPKIPKKGNATFDDLKKQFYSAIKMFPGVRYAERLNVHFARMGEPIFNKSVFDFADWMYKNKFIIQEELNLRIETLHPVLTTCMPAKFKSLRDRIFNWILIKNDTYNGQAGLQLSINSTNEEQRQEMFNHSVLTLEQISDLMKDLPPALGRKYCLNFAYSPQFEVDAKRLVSLFDPCKFMVKITPIHNNTACRDNNISTPDGYSDYAVYSGIEKDLIGAGFDVLVFVPSMDEEDGLVTCGNVVLGGSTVKTSSPINIKGLK